MVVRVLPDESLALTATWAFSERCVRKALRSFANALLVKPSFSSRCAPTASAALVLLNFTVPAVAVAVILDARPADTSTRIPCCFSTRWERAAASASESGGGVGPDDATGGAGAEPGHGGTGRVAEQLDPVQVAVGRVDAVAVHGEAIQLAECGRARAAAVGGDEVAVAVELLDRLLVAHPEVPRGVDRDRERPAERLAVDARHRSDETARCGELLNPVVLVLGHPDVPGGVHRDAIGAIELAVARAVGSPFANEDAGGGELLDAVVAVVGHVDVSVRGERHS